MLLLVGLGNPGPEHRRQRHNVGFMAVDAIAEKHSFQPFRKRFHGELAEGILGGTKTLALKPQAFMNLSGKRSEEHTSELQSLMRISYAVFCLKKKTKRQRKYIIQSVTINHLSSSNIS